MYSSKVHLKIIWDTIRDTKMSILWPHLFVFAGFCWLLINSQLLCHCDCVQLCGKISYQWSDLVQWINRRRIFYDLPSV